MRFFSFLIVVLFALGACTSVKTSFDQTADLSQYSTFYCMECEDEYAKGFEDYDNESVRRQVREAIIQNLQDKGMIYNASDADLLVDYKIIIEEQTAFVAEPDTEYNYWETYDSPQIKFNRGTLIINIIDAAENQVIWQGIGSKVLDDAPEDAKEDILNKVKKILKKFKPSV